MKMTRQTASIAIVAISLASFVLFVPIVWGLVFRGEYSSQATVERSFVITEDFTKVRKILVRTEASKQIVTMGGSSEYIDQAWSGVGGELDPGALIRQTFDPHWRLELHGTLRVRTLDEYIGRQVIDLQQDVEIEPDFLHSEVKLDKPAERLKAYHMTTHFERDEAAGCTQVKLSLTQEILTDAPWFAHGVADRRVRESALRTLANQEEAIRTLVADNINNVPLLPLR
jgi:hypothetical protein